MFGWLHVTLIAAFAGIIIFIFLYLIFQPMLRPKKPPHTATLQSGLAKIHQVTPLSNVSTRKPFFSWDDHPSVVADAVENGWLRFGFTTFVSSSPSATSDHGCEGNVKTVWEVCERSADYMQKISLNPGPNSKPITAVDSSSPMAALSVIRTALPLPGPRFGVSSFPQEAYFEMTILFCYEDVIMEKSGFDGDKNSECLKKIEEGGEKEAILVSVGLTGGENLPLKTPGRFAGSIGFNSCASVYLDGTKIIFESKKNEWARTGNVIGCGYNPCHKKVFFTINSKLVHAIHCKSEQFGHPLYPTIAATADILVQVNLGQSPFKFGPANSKRNPNPCFIGPNEGGSHPIACDCEDSKELFSMERVDPSWRQWVANSSTATAVKAVDCDLESESDLFEIYLR